MGKQQQDNVAITIATIVSIVALFISLFGAGYVYTTVKGIDVSGVEEVITSNSQLLVTGAIALETLDARLSNLENAEYEVPDYENDFEDLEDGIDDNEDAIKDLEDIFDCMYDCSSTTCLTECM